MSPQHRLLGLLATAILLVSTTLFAAPAHAATLRYAALGDSYSAGVGAGGSINDCYQSQKGYPALIASSTGWVLDYRACSGAVVNDVRTKQLPGVSSTTNKITISVGGNDIGFADTLTECAKPGWMSNCDAKIDYTESLINNTLPGRLKVLYGEIRTKAPNAQVVVVGYPRLFNGTDCNILTFFSSAEMTRTNALADRLNVVTGAQAGYKGFAYSDPRVAFTGHAWCDSQAWINGLTWNLTDSYHPNAAGNVAYAQLVSGKLGVRTTYAVTTASTSVGTSELTAEQASQLVPDLASSENLVKAQRAGISVAQIKQLDAALRSGNKARANQAVKQLHALDAQFAAKKVLTTTGPITADR
ncbi:SGNH/GDSL hydrolase family protein [Propionibacteriaceae bacterium G57]|uniref:SGNH/GDSL hydrolase family protein n=1 Tax=Aestuariimicrobium sp. G57 TaxID=3418485 RepID=UPI003DA70DC9